MCYLQECNIDYNVLVLTETWLNENSESLFEIPSFQNISINRNENRRGGGIRVYILNCLVASNIEKLTGIFDTHEALYSLKSR